MAEIVWFDDEDQPAPTLLGGKGAGLVRMRRAGFPVPPGFIITTKATAALEQSDTLSAIVSAFELLNAGGDTAVAVRSSATGEDSEDRSFAGQHETVLNVRDRESLLEAVGRIVASLDAEHAVAYRGAQVEEPAAMAVVVQRMVPATFAGVAFSVDPTGVEDDAVVIEVVAGTGERLMSGQASGARFVVDRRSLEVRGPDGGTAKGFDISTARDIAEAALRAEDVFGSPQDIEFAYDGESLWLLQSRPITAIAADSEGWVSEFDTPTDDNTVWTSANVQEVLPGLLTPLTITVSQESSRVGYNVGFQQLQMLSKDEWQPFMGTFYSRAFLNLSVTRMVADRTLGGSGDAVEQQFLAGKPGLKVEREPFLRRLKFKTKSTLPLTKNLLRIHAVADRIDRQTRALEAEIAALEPPGMSDEGLDDALDRVISHGAAIFGTHLQVSGIASFGFDQVKRLVRPVLKGETEGQVAGLFSGMQGVESARIGVDIWNLATIARNTGIDEAIAEGALNPNDPALPDGWRAAWRTFAATHGHRGLNEMEASARSWRSDPAPVINMVTSYLALDPEQSPPATLRRQEVERFRLTDEVARRMNPLKRKLFRKVLSNAQDWVSLRERTKSVIVRAARIPDYLMPEIQLRLVERGVIDAPEDVYFLTRKEIRDALRAEPVEQLQGHVTRRRREYERNRHIVLPERFRGRPTPITPDHTTPEASILHGTPVSLGIVTGRARVILDPATDGAIEPGEILVAPVTDAGWTPLFAIASGLVVDMGSALSHGSTVAREYGLPAVVNVRSGTRDIRTGDLVTVNGSAGTVTIARTAGED